MTALRGRLASVAVAAALVGGAAAPAVVLAPVAGAHSVLVSIDPEDGSELDTPPDEIVLTFNEEINQNFASVAVTAGDDRATRVVGDPSVAGETVTVDVDDLGPGAYTVGYRVTSSDGHVVSGSSVFTVTGGAGGAEAGAQSGGESGSQAGAESGSQPAAGGDASPAGGSDTGAGDEADVADETSGEDTGINPAIWVVGGLAILLIGGAFVLLRRGN
ncbi:copper resistance CopC family protein [Dietzia maris]|uniref:copper resistance CopC family protein n=1 Tax=Dietzia maris TaxID=37915 RepID=UPI00232E961D|nr:copper resistance CopC family protein [Dietzia maris]